MRYVYIYITDGRVWWWCGGLQDVRAAAARRVAVLPLAGMELGLQRAHQRAVGTESVVAALTARWREAGRDPGTAGRRRMPLSATRTLWSRVTDDLSHAKSVRGEVAAVPLRGQHRGAL